MGVPRQADNLIRLISYSTPEPIVKKAVLGTAGQDPTWIVGRGI